MKNVFTMAIVAAAIVSVPAVAQEAPAGSTVVPSADSQQLEKGAGKRGKHDSRKGERTGRRGGGKLMQMLSEDQKTQFKSIMQASREEVKPLFEKMQALKQASKANGSFDDKSKSEFVAIRQKLKQHREATNQKILAILTPEQKVEFEKMQANRKNGFGGKGMRGGKSFGGTRGNASTQTGFQGLPQ